jgi:hypothetical protein
MATPRAAVRHSSKPLQRSEAPSGLSLSPPLKPVSHPSLKKQGNPDAGGSVSSSGPKPKRMKIPNFGSLADTNATIKVPKGAKRRPLPATGALPKFGSEPVSPFVQIMGSQFDKDCRPFYPTGFNAFELFILAAGALSGAIAAAVAAAAAAAVVCFRGCGCKQHRSPSCDEQRKLPRLTQPIAHEHALKRRGPEGGRRRGVQAGAPDGHDRSAHLGPLDPRRPAIPGRLLAIPPLTVHSSSSRL